MLKRGLWRYLHDVKIYVKCRIYEFTVLEALSALEQTLQTYAYKCPLCPLCSVTLAHRGCWFARPRQLLTSATTMTIFLNAAALL